MKKNEIKLYEDHKIRTLWDSDAEKWYISIVDVISVLTESVNPTAYWRKLKQRLTLQRYLCNFGLHNFPFPMRMV